MAMWMLVLRFVPDAGISIRELVRASGLNRQQARMWLTRLSQWWGYLRIEKRGDTPADWIVHPSRGGREALDVLRPLQGILEERWRARFSGECIDALLDCSQQLLDELDPKLPDFLPILGYDLLTRDAPVASVRGSGIAQQLSKVLYAFALAFEHETHLSLAIASNVLRVVTDEGVRVRDLPKLSGIAKPGIAMCVKRLESAGLAEVRSRTLFLTEAGVHARRRYLGAVAKMEAEWAARYGEPVAELRRVLESILADQARFWQGLKPYKDCWRASVPHPEMLPHYPMILHRGGFPDGS